MFETPSPTHGYFAVTVAFVGYALLAVAITAGLTAGGVALGLPRGIAVVVFPVVALALLRPFLPLFRRLAPGTLRL